MMSKRAMPPCYRGGVAIPGPVMALDVGTAKIGVAFSDAGRRMAFPHSVVPRRGVARDAEGLARLARDRGCTALVVGLPDSEGRMPRIARQVGDAVGALLALPVWYVDEGYTSAEARIRIADAGLRRDTIDAHAAALILQQWLDAGLPAAPLPGGGQESG
jgi:putative Holliday junction resolvase